MNYIEQCVYNLRKKTQLLFQPSNIANPVFPEFKQICYEDKATIESITGAYLPYSDFNFTSAYTWNVEGHNAYSLDGKNLVLKLADYVSGNPVYTVLGNENVHDTIHKVTTLCKSTPGSVMKLIPEVTTQALDNHSIGAFLEDSDNSDYIFSLHDLASLQGGRFKNKRHAANKCERESHINFVNLDSINQEHVAHVKKMVQDWEQEKAKQGKTDNESDTELRALQRVFTHFNDHGSLLLSLAYQNGTLVGFSVDECLTNTYVVSHYFKALPSIPGLSEHFNRYVATQLLNKGYIYWNWEQDLGIQELRQMKHGYRPVAVLKKFALSIS